MKKQHWKLPNHHLSSLRLSTVENTRAHSQQLTIKNEYKSLFSKANHRKRKDAMFIPVQRFRDTTHFNLNVILRLCYWGHYIDKGPGNPRDELKIMFTKKFIGSWCCLQRGTCSHCSLAGPCSKSQAEVIVNLGNWEEARVIFRYLSVLQQVKHASCNY